MSKFTQLTVSQLGGDSSRVAARQVGLQLDSVIMISVTGEGKLTIDHTDRTGRKVINFPDVDIAGLIEFLQDAQTFISEENLVKTLQQQPRHRMFV